MKKLKIKQDKRGKFIEIFKWPKCGQISYSVTRPGFIRGEHYHTRKIEKFCVIEGKAEINLRQIKTGKKKKYLVSGKQPKIIDIFPLWTHNIINKDKKNDLKLIIWVNEIFKAKDPDTFKEKV